MPLSTHAGKFLVANTVPWPRNFFLSMAVSSSERGTIGLRFLTTPGGRLISWSARLTQGQTTFAIAPVRHPVSYQNVNVGRRSSGISARSFSNLGPSKNASRGSDSFCIGKYGTFETLLSRSASLNIRRSMARLRFTVGPATPTSIRFDEKLRSTSVGDVGNVHAAKVVVERLEDPTAPGDQDFLAIHDRLA